MSPLNVTLLHNETSLCFAASPIKQNTSSGISPTVGIPAHTSSSTSGVIADFPAGDDCGLDCEVACGVDCCDVVGCLNDMQPLIKNIKMTNKTIKRIL